MHSENNELSKAGHELAKCLDSNTPLTEIAKLITRLATALDVTTLAVREATKQLDQVAQAVGWVEGGNFTLAETVGGHVSGLKAAAKRSEELAADNAALKSKGRELLNEACGVYEKYNATINPENGDFMDGQTLHEFQFLMDVETPATDAFLREVKAQGVEEFVKRLRDSADIYDKNGRHEWADHNRVVADDGNVFAAELRQGGAA
ncbi:hypothetical protein MQ487_000479 [Cronobacter sakazakii]|nr:hypothetical protein [Cronobacter sakazakii]EME1731727.1 hypothetical protein [Cronobacter sakazakii]EME1758788.1 hypothetical protein [Cronobacter sakazakii]